MLAYLMIVVFVTPTGATAIREEYANKGSCLQARAELIAQSREWSNIKAEVACIPSGKVEGNPR